jgi:uncharacterized protein YbjT (DUF2867 family)
MSEKTAAILGSTGMIGSYLLDLILTDKYYDTVKLLVRRPIQKNSERVEVKLVDFSDAESFKLALEGCDTIFSCIGTTQKNVKGDNQLYRKIDFDIPLKAARFGKDAGCTKFILVSSVGAKSESGTFYLRLKGELEEAIRQVGLDAVYIMQPSMLLGERTEKRTAEKVMQGAMKFLNPVLGGSLRKYRAIHGKTVANAMLNLAKDDRRGFYRYTYDDIKRLGESHA